MIKELEEKELSQLHRLAVEELRGTGESLIVWAGGDAVNQQDEVAKKFMERFPEIPLDIKVDLSKNHDIKIYEELLEGDLTPDVVMLQTSNDFEDWKKMDVLESFKPIGFSQIREEFVDPEGAFSVFRMFAFLPQYAKSGVQHIPTDLTDFFTPEFQGKIISTYPHDDDAVLYVYDEMIKQQGMSFLDEFAKLNPFFVRGTAGPPLLVGRNGFLGGLTGYETVPDQPSESFIPDKDFFISWAQRIAMFKLTKHKAASRLFLAFVQSMEFQESLGHYSVRKDVDFKKIPWIGSHSNTNPLGFYEFMRNRKHIHELRQIMKDYFGPVEGVSPVEDHRMIKLTYGWEYF